MSLPLGTSTSLCHSAAVAAAKREVANGLAVGRPQKKPETARENRCAGVIPKLCDTKYTECTARVQGNCCAPAGSRLGKWTGRAPPAAEGRWSLGRGSRGSHQPSPALSPRLSLVNEKVRLTSVSLVFTPSPLATSPDMPSVDTTPSTTVDTLIVGGGPLGLLTALQLAKMGCSALLVG